MRYLGGKSKIAKRIAEVLRPELEKVGGLFIEPFVGGFNLVPHLQDYISTAYCSDIHSDLISLYKDAQNGWRPPETITEDQYKTLKMETYSPLRTLASFTASFGGKEWGGFARDRKTGRDIPAEGCRNFSAKIEHMKKCVFSTGGYADILLPEECLVYCDPPYSGTTGYKTGNFDSESFYDWCEKITTPNRVVYVSEFSAPTYWEVVYEKNRKVTASVGIGKEKTERLYRVRNK